MRQAVDNFIEDFFTEDYPVNVDYYNPDEDYEVFGSLYEEALAFVNNELGDLQKIVTGCKFMETPAGDDICDHGRDHGEGCFDRHWKKSDDCLGKFANRHTDYFGQAMPWDDWVRDKPRNKAEKEALTKVSVV